MTSTITEGPRPWPADPYDRAMAAEPRLRPIERLVTAFAALAPSGRSCKSMCCGCVWEEIVKPLALPLVGWGRGYPPGQAHAEPPPELVFQSAAELCAEIDQRPAAENGTEAWLRTSEAWDAVTDPWIARLEAADPANGHGIGASCE